VGVDTYAIYVRFKNGLIITHASQSLSTTAMELIDTEDYSFPPASFKPLLTDISGLLRSTSSTLAVAETTTGGLVSAALLSVPGASKFFVGGATLYTTKSRRVWAGWTDKNLMNYKSVYRGG